MNSKKSYCINCNKCGHNSKECIEPIYSYGIICIKINDTIIPSPLLIENYLINKIIDIDEFNLLIKKILMNTIDNRNKYIINN